MNNVILVTALNGKKTSNIDLRTASQSLPRLLPQIFMEILGYLGVISEEAILVITLKSSTHIRHD